MDWTALLNHLKIGRIVIVAAFAAAAGIHFGPRLWPAYFPPAPTEWAAVPVGVLIFTGFLISAWIAQFLLDSVLHVSARWRVAVARTTPLTSMEARFLFSLSQTGRSALSLDDLPYQELGISRLEIRSLADGLAKKGLLDVSFDVVSMTKPGEHRALEIERAFNKRRQNSPTGSAARSQL